MAASMKRTLQLKKRSIKFSLFRNVSTKTTDTKEFKDKRETHFGFETVPENEKENRVYEVFASVASKYDLMNDAMSFGVHRLWKDHFIQRLAPTQGTQLLDVAGGTGDIAFRFLQYIDTQNENQLSMEDEFTVPKNIEAGAYSIPQDYTDDNSDNFSEILYNPDTSHVTVCDINQEMLDVGKLKAEEAGLTSGISWTKANAESLPFDDNVFDAYTIAFGIRNCTHIEKVLSEAFRVLKPGGRFMCLEFSHINPLLRGMYDSYSFEVIPVMGQVLARDWKSYQYLVESIRQFPNQEKFASMIRRAGFMMVAHENLTFGIAAVHSGFKIVARQNIYS